MNQSLQALEAQLNQTQTHSEKLGLLDQLYQFLRVSDLRRAKETVEGMLLLSQNTAYPTGRGLALKNLGDYHFRQGSLPAAQGCLEEALSILRGTGEIRGEVDTLNALGNFHYFQGNFPRALEYYLEALEQSRKYEHKALESNALNGVGIIQYTLGNYQEATKYFLRSLALKREIGDRLTESGTLNNLGLVYLEMGDYPGAVQLYRESLGIKQTLGDLQGEANALSNLGVVFQRLGRTQEALDYHQQALEIADRLGSPQVRATCLENLGRSQAMLGNLEPALELFQSSKALHRELGNRLGELSVLLQIGMALGRQAQTDAAILALQQGLKMAEELGPQKPLLDFHQALSGVFEQIQKPALALHHLKQAIEIERRLHKEQQAQRTAALLAGFQVEKARQEAEIERLRNTELARANRELARAIENLKEADAEKSRLLDKLRQQSRELERLARQDPLTRLYNRRYLEENLEREFAASRRYKFPLSVALVDIDHFKQINDSFSHQIGDDVLRLVGQILESSCRGVDFASRYGGEEFALVFPQTDLVGALIACERVRQRIAGYDWSDIHPRLAVTVSIGVGSDPTLSNHEKLLSAADQQLYAAKRAGRNRVFPPT
ncbi:tetratricopeptide repeat protein [uncultured Meiothermus sp.]|jgi:diguanylate cyclase (GGDEF)-like protein|uniref:tetratricopeptide repeat-containing diguanylate cyclase n=1 Tax=uncultured Meiothermus sp. TaxID=157471 RepID=UPI0026346AE6|nr:tetratricopeptide repeat protein [uncultured Meiothermus sp.]